MANHLLHSHDSACGELSRIPNESIKHKSFMIKLYDLQQHKTLALSVLRAAQG
jgi:hypothetical protein